MQTSYTNTRSQQNLLAISEHGGNLKEAYNYSTYNLCLIWPDCLLSTIYGSNSLLLQYKCNCVSVLILVISIRNISILSFALSEP